MLSAIAAAARPPRVGHVGDRPTIYDVAREAGVAASTVSRAYARPGRVNAETAARDLRGRRADRLPLRAASPARSASRPAPSRWWSPTSRTRSTARSSRAPQEAARRGGLRAAALRTPTRPAAGRARGRRARAGPRRGHRAGQLADERLRDPDDRQAEAAGAAEPADPRDVLHRHRQRRAGCGGPSSTSARSATTRSPTSPGPEASWADGMRWRALRGGGARAGAPGAPRRPVRRPDRARRLRRRAPGRRARARRRCSPTTTRWPSASSRACKQLGVRGARRRERRRLRQRRCSPRSSTRR